MNNTNLKVLVVDDEPKHRRAAEILLKGHRLTIVGSYDEAKDALTAKTDYRKEDAIRADLLEKAGLSRDFNPYRGQNVSQSDKKKYSDLSKTAREEATTRPDFDVVLLDLMMPASRAAQGPEGMPFVGKLLTVGTFLILLALEARVKNIGMVTDMNHHNHPASAALDPINRSVISVGETKIFATNYPELEFFDEKTGEVLSFDYLQSPAGKEKYPGDYDSRQGTFTGKGWHNVLKKLLGEVAVD